MPRHCFCGAQQRFSVSVVVTAARLTKQGLIAASVRVCLWPEDGVIGRRLVDSRRFGVLRFRLMVKRSPCLRPQASEGEAQHGHFAGLDVSVKETSVCVVDDTAELRVK